MHALLFSLAVNKINVLEIFARAHARILPRYTRSPWCARRESARLGVGVIKKKNGEERTGLSCGRFTKYLPEEKRRFGCSSSEEDIVVTEEQNRENMEDDEDGDDSHEVSVRVLGTLESFDPTKSLGVLKDDNFALTFDASSVLPTFKWKLKSLYFLIGEYEKREEREGPHSSSSLSILRNGSLRVRIAQNASGLDVNAYHEAAKIREEFLR